MFRSKILAMPSVIAIAQRMCAAARVMDIPLIVTEQYTKAFGKTCEEIDVSRGQVFEKTQFSMLVPPVVAALESSKRKNVVLFGIEAHICVQQSALALLERGYNVYGLADGISSQRDHDRQLALALMRDAGVRMTSNESLLYSLMADAKSPTFKAMLPIIKDSLPDPQLR